MRARRATDRRRAHPADRLRLRQDRYGHGATPTGTGAARQRTRTSAARTRSTSTRGVRLDASLWGPDAEPFSLTVGLFESYLERRRDGRAAPARPPGPAERAEALESLLVERGLVDPNVVDVHPPLRERRRPAERRQGRRHAPGPTRSTGPGCSPTARPRSPSSASAARRASTSSCWRTRRTTTSSSARCARATRGRCSGFRRPGTRTRLPLAGRPRAADTAGRDGPGARRRRRDQGLGQQLRGALPGAARASGGHRGPVGGGAGRRWSPATPWSAWPGVGAVTGRSVTDRARALDVDGPASPPRSNGELVFAEPWESRAFGLAMALHQDGVFDWDEFHDPLIAAIAAGRRPPRPRGLPYYGCWLEALEALLDERACRCGAGDRRRPPTLAADRRARPRPRQTTTARARGRRRRAPGEVTRTPGRGPVARRLPAPGRPAGSFDARRRRAACRGRHGYRPDADRHLLLALSSCFALALAHVAAPRRRRGRPGSASPRRAPTTDRRLSVRRTVDP